MEFGEGKEHAMDRTIRMTVDLALNLPGTSIGDAIKFLEETLNEEISSIEWAEIVKVEFLDEEDGA